MFGFRKKPRATDEQIPYEIYETVHQPAVRRRRWIIRLVVALVVVTLLIVGFMTWRNRNDANQPKEQSGANSSSQQPPAGEQQNPPGQPSRQAPQSNAPIPKPEAPATAPDGGKTNTGTVNRPE